VKVRFGVLSGNVCRYRANFRNGGVKLMALNWRCSTERPRFSPFSSVVFVSPGSTCDGWEDLSMRSRVASQLVGNESPSWSTALQR